MSIWEWITVFGFTATILGVFLTIYGMINNKTLKTESRLTREILDRIEQGQIKSHEETMRVFDKIADLIVREGERTREAISSH